MNVTYADSISKREVLLELMDLQYKKKIRHLTFLMRHVLTINLFLINTYIAIRWEYWVSGTRLRIRFTEKGSEATFCGTRTVIWSTKKPHKGDYKGKFTASKWANTTGQKRHRNLLQLSLTETNKSSV